jgi:hypothetical protein
MAHDLRARQPRISAQIATRPAAHVTDHVRPSGGRRRGRGRQASKSKVAERFAWWLGLGAVKGDIERAAGLWHGRRILTSSPPLLLARAASMTSRYISGFVDDLLHRLVAADLQPGAHRLVPAHDECQFVRLVLDGPARARRHEPGEPSRIMIGRCICDRAILQVLRDPSRAWRRDTAERCTADAGGARSRSRWRRARRPLPRPPPRHREHP